MKLFSARVLTEQGWQQNQLLTIEQGLSLVLNRV